jgi:hypothetical protein
VKLKRPPVRVKAYVVELDQTVRDESRRRTDRYWLGRFRGYVETEYDVPETFEGLTFDAALAWAAERSEDVVLRVGDDEVPADGDQPERRRFAAERWKDRTALDPPIAWRVDVTIAPRIVTWDAERRRDELEREVATVATVSGASRWDRRERESGAAWTLRLDHVEAATESHAITSAELRVRLPAGWTTTSRATPA